MLKKRHWLYQKQVGDLRIRLCFIRRRGREFVLHFERREKWLWIPYFKVKYLDIPAVRSLMRHVDDYLRG